MAGVRRWQQFSDDVFGDPFFVWHDGADFTELLRRWEGEPAIVQAMLLDGLGSGASLAAQSVAVLARRGARLDGCLEPLRGALVRAAGTFRVAVADALFAITGDPAWGIAMLPVLRAESLFDRFDAAIALRAFRATPAMIDALEATVQDREYLVRHHSANTLLAFAGRRPESAEDPALFALLTSRNPRRWRRAAEQLAQDARRALD